MNEIFKPDWFGGMENEKDYELELAVPGRKKEDFNIEIDKDVLTISSEIKYEDEAKEENYTRREFGFSSFKRAFTLPETIDSDKIEANYEDGLLKFVLPKKEEALPKPKRMIELS
jgi:HSP20 family protein